MIVKKEVVEIVSPFVFGDPTHRMRVHGLRKALSDDFSFFEFGSSLEAPSCILINSFHHDIDSTEFIKILSDRCKEAVVMLMIADFFQSSIEQLIKWSKFVDVFLVPTPEMQQFIQIHTSKKVEVLIDPIDFGLENSENKSSNRTLGMRVVWFGFPESYTKSMGIYEGKLVEMHQAGEIEFHIVSKNSAYGKSPNGFIHEYVPETFLELLSRFDVCIASHIPLDFSISTAWKSENKAILAINRGLPVVASNTPAYKRLLEDCGQSQFLFSTSQELEVGLKKLMDPQVRESYLQNSQNFILKKYSSKKVAKDWVEILQRAKLTKSR